jgi:monoamine oxidase
LNVLPEVEFIPSLPKNVETLIDQGQMSGGIKVVMKVKGNRDPYMALAAADSQFVLCQYDRELEDGNHLTTAFGPDASIIDGDDVQAVQEAMRQWFPDIEVLETAHFSWTNDPNFKGTWAVPTPGQMDSLLEIADIKGKIVFAGADIAKGNYALIDGAIDSGMQAGRSVSELLSSTEASAISNSASLKKDSVDRLWNQVHGSVISEHHS